MPWEWIAAGPCELPRLQSSGLLRWLQPVRLHPVPRPHCKATPLRVNQTAQPLTHGYARACSVAFMTLNEGPNHMNHARLPSYPKMPLNCKSVCYSQEAGAWSKIGSHRCICDCATAHDGLCCMRRVSLTWSVTIYLLSNVPWQRSFAKQTAIGCKGCSSDRNTRIVCLLDVHGWRRLNVLSSPAQKYYEYHCFFCHQLRNVMNYNAFFVPSLEMLWITMLPLANLP